MNIFRIKIEISTIKRILDRHFPNAGGTEIDEIHRIRQISGHLLQNYDSIKPPKNKPPRNKRI